MNIETVKMFKYTFMIIPFKFEGNINEEEIARFGYLLPCDHNRIKYDRLYKHVANSISGNNPERSIYDYWVNREEYFSEVFRHPLNFKVVTENKKTFTTEGYLKDIFVYCFENGIGFIVVNFVFDENIDINTMCEILNKLKK